jgi:hypothetical protein
MVVVFFIIILVVLATLESFPRPVKININAAPKDKRMIPRQHASENKKFNTLPTSSSKPSIEPSIRSQRLSNEERLQKVIARAGLASRRDAQRMVRSTLLRVKKSLYSLQCQS